jgi:hypothetical protein
MDNNGITYIFIRILAIVYITALYVVFGIILTYNLDKYVFRVDKTSFNAEIIYKEKLSSLILNLVSTVCIIAVLSYLVKHLVQAIPFPFDGLEGFDYRHVKEVDAGHILLIILFSFSQTISKEYKEIKIKLNDYDY